MRYIALLFGLLFLVSLNASAQTTASNSLLLPSSYYAVPAPSATPAINSSISLTPFSTTPAPTPPGTFASSTPLSLMPAPAPQDVTSVFQSYSWQLYFGYTYLRFFELPHITENMNGFNYSMAYYFKDWIAADGEFAATHGTQDSVSSWFLFGGGGPRFRWSAPKGVELWAHALAGYSHFTPQTPAGVQHAFAFELGGGVDLPFKSRWAIRLGADAMCSRYFSTYQYSPTAHAGVVFKF